MICNLHERIRAITVSHIGVDVHLNLLQDMAYKAEANILKYRKEEISLLEWYWIGRYMTVKEIIENLERATQSA